MHYYYYCSCLGIYDSIIGKCANSLKTVTYFCKSHNNKVLLSDYVGVFGGVHKVPILKELLTSAAARSRYWLHLEEQKRKKITDTQAQKWKAAEETIEELKRKKQTLQQVSSSLCKDADHLLEEAEGKGGALMGQLITKSNTLRKRYKKKGWIRTSGSQDKDWRTQI